MLHDLSTMPSRSNANPIGLIEPDCLNGTESLAVGSPLCFFKDATDETQVFESEHETFRDVAY